MFIQQTTHNYGPLTMPMFVKPTDDGRNVTVRFGVGGDVHMSFTPDEAERLRDGITAALTAMRGEKAA